MAVVTVDRWGSPARGSFPLAWTLQPMLHELHPYFLAWLLESKSPQDDLLVGPSGAVRQKKKRALKRAKEPRKSPDNELPAAGIHLHRPLPLRRRAR